MRDNTSAASQRARYRSERGADINVRQAQAHTKLFRIILPLTTIAIVSLRSRSTRARDRIQKLSRLGQVALQAIYASRASSSRVNVLKYWTVEYALYGKKKRKKTTRQLLRALRATFEL